MLDPLPEKFLTSGMGKVAMTEKEALIALTSFVPFGPVRLNLLISYFGSAKESWGAGHTVLENIGLGKESLIRFLTYRRAFNLSRYLKNLRRLKIDVVTKGEKNYPQALTEIDSSPLLLYFKGNIKNLEPALAIVGSRKMTPYGKEIAERFAMELASMGICIISGLARGVDTTAHWGAIRGGGKTVAVLGCGLDTLYPPENTKLAQEIVSLGGALISEYPLGYPPLKNNFPARNRIISGLAKGVLVVEGAARSGTLSTASQAAEQGRAVFAVPGPIYSPNSAAPHFLLKNGAIPVTSLGDILEEMGMDNVASRGSNNIGVKAAT